MKKLILFCLLMLPLLSHSSDISTVIIGGVAPLDIVAGNGEWLRLDATNDPLTGDLDLGANLTFDTSGTDDFQWRRTHQSTPANTNEPTLMMVNAGESMYPIFTTFDSDGTDDVQLNIAAERSATGIATVVAGYNAFGLPNYVLGTHRSGTGTNYPLHIGFEVFSNKNIVLEDATSVELNAVLRRDTNDVADASKADDMVVEGGNKTAGTGNGGDYVLKGGTSVGGRVGVVRAEGSPFGLHNDGFTLVGDGTTITVDESVLELTSDSVTATDRTFNIDAGQNGQLLTIVWMHATNRAEMLDLSLHCLSADWLPDIGDTLSLVWVGALGGSGCWAETARSAN